MNKENKDSFNNSHSEIAKSSLLQYLGNEIDILKSQHTKPGWTTWAIIGAVATIIWIGIGEFEKIDIDYHEFILFIVGLLFFLDVLNILKLLIAPGNFKLSHMRSFFFTNKLLGGSRFYILFVLFKYLIIIVITFTFHLISGFYLVCFLIVYVLELIVFLLMLLLSWWNFPLGTSSIQKNNKNTNISLWILTLFGICGCYGFLEAILNNHIIEIAEFKFYILPVVAFYLLEKLVSQSTSNPLVDSLIDIRRDLVFNNTPVEDALKQAEIAILGLKFKEIIHEDSAKLIELIRLIKGNYLLVSDRIKNMSQDIANLKSGKPLIEKVIEKTEEFKVIFESCHYQSSLAKNHVTEALKISHRLRQKLKFLVLMYDIKDEVDELICKVEDEIRNFESVANNLENNIIELEKQAESLFHREDKRPEQLT